VRRLLAAVALCAVACAAKHEVTIDPASIGWSSSDAVLFIVTDSGNAALLGQSYFFPSGTKEPLRFNPSETSEPVRIFARAYPGATRAPSGTTLDQCGLELNATTPYRPGPADFFGATSLIRLDGGGQASLIQETQPVSFPIAYSCPVTDACNAITARQILKAGDYDYLDGLALIGGGHARLTAVLSRSSSTAPPRTVLLDFDGATVTALGPPLPIRGVTTSLAFEPATGTLLANTNTAQAGGGSLVRLSTAGAMTSTVPSLTLTDGPDDRALVLGTPDGVYACASEGLFSISGSVATRLGDFGTRGSCRTAAPVRRDHILAMLDTGNDPLNGGDRTIEFFDGTAWRDEISRPASEVWTVLGADENMAVLGGRPRVLRVRDGSGAWSSLEELPIDPGDKPQGIATFGVASFIVVTDQGSIAIRLVDHWCPLMTLAMISSAFRQGGANLEQVAVSADRSSAIVIGRPSVRGQAVPLLVIALPP
jgi:hypothetical protein